MKPPTSAIPPSKFFLGGLPTGGREVTLRLTNFSKRVFVDKLREENILNLVAQVEAARRDGESTAQLNRRFAERFSLAAQAKQLACMLFAMTRYDHEELEYRDCLAAVPFEAEEFKDFQDTLMQVYGQWMPEAKPKEEPKAEDANPTKPAKKPATLNGGKRSKGNSRSRSAN